MEEPVCFSCRDKRLFGILHLPDGIPAPSIIVLIVTGGPQVRAGAHRLYVNLSRFLCENNWPSLRFDYEGMGDSEGDFVGFQYAVPSINAAMNFLHNRFNTEVKFILWSLCDGATAAALYAPTHQEHINGMVLCNPLTITDEGLARSTLKHYYVKRIFDKEFLHKLAAFKLDLRCTLKGLWRTLKDALNIGLKNRMIDRDETKQKLPDIVFHSLHNFSKPVRIILSTDDIVASNFQDELKRNRSLEKDYQRKKIINQIIQGADHTFTDPRAKKEMFSITLQSLNDIVSEGNEK